MDLRLEKREIGIGILEELKFFEFLVVFFFFGILTFFVWNLKKIHIFLTKFCIYLFEKDLSKLSYEHFTIIKA